MQRTTPYSWPSIVGGHHEVDAPADLFTAGKSYTFDQWTQGTDDRRPAVPRRSSRPANGTALNAGYSPTTPGCRSPTRRRRRRRAASARHARRLAHFGSRRAPVTVDYTTSERRRARRARPAGSDYDGEVGHAHLPRRRRHAVDRASPSIGDTTIEGDEQFARRSSRTRRAHRSSTATAAVTIVDDDAGAGLRLSVGDVKVLESNGGNRNATVTVTLSAPSPGGVSVRLRDGERHRDRAERLHREVGDDHVQARTRPRRRSRSRSRATARSSRARRLAFALSNPVGAVIDARSAPYASRTTTPDPRSR